MKIIILGAGQVGSTAAHQLAREQANDVTVVDTRDEVLRDLQDRLDISTVSGNAAHPATLLAAGSKGADLLVALTSSDEVNMIACQIAWTLFRTPTKIARIRSGDYYERPELFGDNAIPVDLAISPEQLVTDYVERLIRYPGALQVLELAEGRVLLAGMRALKGGKLVGHQLQALRAHIPNREVRVAAIYRGGRSILPEGGTTIEEHDEVFFVAARDDMRAVMKEFSSEEASVRRVVIAGAGNIGFRLARALEERLQVKLIERNPDRARRAAETLRNTLVLTGNAADAEEVVQDVFLTVSRKHDSFEGRSALGSWIYRVTMNAALNRRRGKRAEVETSLDELLPTYRSDGHREGDRSVVLADWSRRPDEELLSGEARAQLERALDALPDRYRAVLVLRDVEGQTNEEVAAMLGESVASVKSSSARRSRTRGWRRSKVPAGEGPMVRVRSRAARSAASSLPPPMLSERSITNAKCAAGRSCLTSRIVCSTLFSRRRRSPARSTREERTRSGTSTRSTFSVSFADIAAVRTLALSLVLYPFDHTFALTVRAASDVPKSNAMRYGASRATPASTPSTKKSTRSTFATSVVTSSACTPIACEFGSGETNVVAARTSESSMTRATPRVG